MRPTENEKDIASFAGRLLRERFGKGPEAAHVVMQGPFITIYLRHFLSPMERVILEQEGEQAVFRLRESMMHKIVPEINGYVQSVTGQEFKNFYHDSDFNKESSIFVGIDENAYDGEDPFKEYAGKKKLEERVRQVTAEAEKEPDKVFSGMLNNKTVLVIREGLLINIEKELVEQGYEEQLKVTKRKLEKRLLIEGKSFTSIAGINIADVFVDWDFERDRSVIVFIMSGSG